MKISQEIQTLFEKWAREAAKNKRSVPVLPLKKKIMDYLQGLFPGDDIVEINDQTIKIREYVKTITDHAKIIAHTEASKESTRNVLKECREYGNDLVEVSQHYNPCEICAKYEGKIYSISGKHPKYPILKERPPFHDGCGHILCPTSDEAIAVRNNEIEKGKL